MNIVPILVSAVFGIRKILEFSAASFPLGVIEIVLGFAQNFKKVRVFLNCAIQCHIFSLHLL